MASTVLWIVDWLLGWDGGVYEGWDGGFIDSVVQDIVISTGECDGDPSMNVLVFEL